MVPLDVQSPQKALAAKKSVLFLEKKKIKSERRKVRFHLEQMQRVLLWLSSEGATFENRIAALIRTGICLSDCRYSPKQINKTQLSLNVIRANV